QERGGRQVQYTFHALAQKREMRDHRDMLELRPGCENCNKALPPDSNEAWICSFECTFCADCVTTVLNNVCPNCGGGFERRPIRPARNWRKDNFLGQYPAGTQARHRPVDRTAHSVFVGEIEAIPPDKR